MSRISYKNIASGAYQAMLGLERCVGESGLDHALLELARTRLAIVAGWH